MKFSFYVPILWGYESEGDISTFISTFISNTSKVFDLEDVDITFGIQANKSDEPLIASFFVPLIKDKSIRYFIGEDYGNRLSYYLTTRYPTHGIITIMDMTLEACCLDNLRKISRMPPNIDLYPFSRFMEGSEYSGSSIRRIGSKVITLLFNKVSSFQVSDATYSLRSFKENIFPDTPLPVLWGKQPFETQIIFLSYLIFSAGCGRIKEIPTTYKGGRSSLRLVDIWKEIRMMIRALFRKDKKLYERFI